LKRLSVRSLIPETIPFSAKLFLTGVIFQGIANGIFNVILQLYFTSLGFSGSTIGSISMMSALSSTILTIPIGIISDRIGKRKLLLLGLGSIAIGTIIFLGSQSPLMIMISFLCIGVTNSTFVVLSPLYSLLFSDDDMDKAFSLWMSLNVITQSLGSLLGYIPPFLVNVSGITFQRAYWFLLVFAAPFFVGQCIFFLLSVESDVIEPSRKDNPFFLPSKGLVLKFSILGFLSSAAFWVFIGLFPFYVNQKLGIQSDALGTLMFVSSFTLAAAQMVAPKISERLGSVKTIALVVGLAAPFYMLIPFTASFTVVSVCYLMMFSLAAMASPLISSIFMKNLVDEEKSTANGINMMFGQGGKAVGPWLGGQLMDRVSLGFPALLGGGIYAITAVLTLFLLKNVDSSVSIEK
jgi:DHA1 family multidrug resistance protein-like MFS transporter